MLRRFAQNHEAYFPRLNVLLVKANKKGQNTGQKMESKDMFLDLRVQKKRMLTGS